MWPGLHAKNSPDKPAYIMASSGLVVTNRELDEGSNRLAHLLKDRGLEFGDHIAIFMDNNAHYLQVAWAAQRSGLYFPPINFNYLVVAVSYTLVTSAS